MSQDKEREDKLSLDDQEKAVGMLNECLRWISDTQHQAGLYAGGWKPQEPPNRLKVRIAAFVATCWPATSRPPETVDEASKSAQAVKGEPVAHLWQHSETGRTRVVMPDQIVTMDANWLVVGPLVLASPPSREPQWQPIETAPEETDVLLWLADGRPPAVAALFNGDWTSFDGPIYAPTHWMPLPPPPGIHSREGGSNG